MKDEQINKLIKMEDTLCELEERIEKAQNLTTKAKKNLAYTAIIWSICTIILLFTTSNFIIFLFIISALPVFILTIGKMAEIIFNKKFLKLKQKYEVKRQEFEVTNAAKKQFEEEMAVYKK